MSLLCSSSNVSFPSTIPPPHMEVQVPPCWCMAQFPTAQPLSRGSSHHFLITVNLTHCRNVLEWMSYCWLPLALPTNIYHLHYVVVAEDKISLKPWKQWEHHHEQASCVLGVKVTPLVHKKEYMYFSFNLLFFLLPVAIVCSLIQVLARGCWCAQQCQDDGSIDATCCVTLFNTVMCCTVSIKIVS